MDPSVYIINIETHLIPYSSCSTVCVFSIASVLLFVKIEHTWNMNNIVSFLRDDAFAT